VRKEIEEYEEVVEFKTEEAALDIVNKMMEDYPRE
jgi:hypothetical protein